MNPRRSENSTVQSRSTAPRRRFSSGAARAPDRPHRRGRSGRTVVHAFALDRLAHVEDAERPERAERKREQRVDEAVISPRSKAIWVAIVKTMASASASSSERQRRRRMLPSGTAQPSRTINDDVQPARRIRERHAAQQRGDGVGPDFRAGHALSRWWTSHGRPGGAGGGADDRDLAGERRPAGTCLGLRRRRGSP